MKSNDETVRRLTVCRGENRATPIFGKNHAMPTFGANKTISDVMISNDIISDVMISNDNISRLTVTSATVVVVRALDDLFETDYQDSAEAARSRCLTVCFSRLSGDS